LKEESFILQNNQCKCIKDIKESIVSGLAFFDHTCRTIELKVNALKHRLGAEISANNNIFRYASRALDKIEQNYSRLEKELYTIVY